ncbi:JAB domain-containing protein [Alginatibacterium sediminis]|uniref:JAB domain-containing protein n=1 Tax=Alginatibacterium sediminis TaxID=2164068 RepID=A0A420EN85_9ALTE|nr:DNA repair protein RadC [Alginatibacterium sediminis]RKF22138.1 JAB domain-containing protein [Alginatibacterium sediminis]
MKLYHCPKHERPREKLIALGASSLSDAELLAIFLRTGTTEMNAIELSQHLLNHYGSLANIVHSSEQQFYQQKGLGPAKYAQLKASVEISNRCLFQDLTKKSVLEDTKSAEIFLKSQLSHQTREVFALLLLDNQHRVLQFAPIFFGTIDAASVYPRIVVQKVLENNAAAVILAHNHPSGVAEPSQADRQITERLINALALIDVRVLDHIVVGQGSAVSFAQRGWI